MTNHRTFLDIAVSKPRLDCACRPDGVAFNGNNDDAGSADLLARLQLAPAALIVLEASGGFEMPVVAALVTVMLPVVVVNPRQVRDFAKASGQLAKTDAIDAGVLAHFGEAVRPNPRAVL